MALTLELNINWSVFDTIQRELIQKGIDDGNFEHLAAILYEVTPEQAQEIEKIQRQLRPREFKFESQVQQDFEGMMSKMPIHDLTPELVNEWQGKIDIEKEEKLKMLNGGFLPEVKVQTVDGSNVTLVTMTNDLHSVKGLGETSVKRLNASNIYSVDELRKLPQDKRQEILGPLVTAKIKSLT